MDRTKRREMTNDRTLAARARRTLFILLLGSVLTFPTLNAQGQSWAPIKIQLSKNEVIAAFPQLAVQDSVVHAVWWEQSRTPGEPSQIFYSRSMDGGFTFSPPQNISSSPTMATAPLIAVEDENVYVMWQEFRRTQCEIGVCVDLTDLIVRASINGGQTFSEPVNVSNTASVITGPSGIEILFPRGNDGHAQLVVSGQNVFVAWQDFIRIGQATISFSQSNDGGQTFSSPMRLDESVGFPDDPKIAVSPCSLIVEWQDSTGIFVKRSIDGGVSFESVVQVSSNGQANRLTLGSSNVYVMWHGPLPVGNIFESGSQDCGVSFSPAINVSMSSREAVVPELAISEPHLYVVWRQDIGEHEGQRVTQTFFSHSSDQGQNFSPPQRIMAEAEREPVWAQGQTIAAFGSRVFITWQEFRPQLMGSDIYFADGEEYGTEFADSVNVSQSAATALDSHVAANDGGAFMVWTELIQVPAGPQGDIFFAHVP